MKTYQPLAAIRLKGHRGMALIEALVALAVMAFGLLGVVGMQTTLRFNADVSRQRAEAVRMAQEQLETLRAFGVLSGATGALPDYAGIATGSFPPAPPVGFANTTFTRTATVVTPGADDLKMKSVTVRVSWLDRRTVAGGTPEAVQLTSNIAAVAPELAATLGLPGDRSATQRPRGRNVSIPPAATDLGNGTSSFAPPGAGTTTWTFVNATGHITSICNLLTGACASVQGLLLSGFINFATGGLPTALEAESPVDPVPTTHTLVVNVNVTPTPATSPICYTQALSLQVAYYCLVPTSGSPTVWSGRSLLDILRISTGSSDLSSSLSDSSPSRFKVCRYTPQASDITTPTGNNQAHPLDYTNVSSSLSNQNFLVINAGDVSGNAFSCPGDGPDPQVNSNTYRHQPSS